MDGATSPAPGDELELSVLEGQPDEQTPLSEVLQVLPSPDEQTPLNGALQVLPSSAQNPCTAEANKEDSWSSCNKNVIGRCKLWMVIVSIFVGLIIVIIIGLCLTGVTYVDEDENEIRELSSNKTFFLMLKIPEECVTEKELPHLLTERLTDVYSKSPSLSRYFTSVKIVDYSGKNATAIYHLQFGVPSEDADFMKYMMSEELLLGILLQDFHDESVPSCESLGLDPESLLLYE
ncbi:TPA-induced transmembrane protein [Castor canadensis]|jgi:hypothetical protein|uniref:TPA-induced transmembrane protein n=1 Tax=Castor canadensis TaxID=51338 RepID=A0AC58MIH3_CASCN